LIAAHIDGHADRHQGSGIDGTGVPGTTADPVNSLDAPDCKRRSRQPLFCGREYIQAVIP
jgi:hypothetical protein